MATKTSARRDLKLKIDVPATKDKRTRNQKKAPLPKNQRIQDDLFVELVKLLDVPAWKEICTKMIDDAKAGDKDARRDLIRIVLEGDGDRLTRIYGDRRSTTEKIKDFKETESAVG